MIQVPVEIALKSGAKLAKPIYGASGQILLRDGVVLDKRYAGRLQSLGIQSVFIEGGKVKVDEPIAAEVRIKAARALSSVGRGHINKVNLCSIVSEILEDVLSLRGIVDSLSSISTYDGYTYTHSVEVCVIAMSIGLQLGYKRHTLLELGIGGLLHDVGKLKIPYHIISKPGTLNKKELDLVKNHPVLGYEMVKNHSQVSNRSAAMVLEHHERWDGSGYPDGKAGKGIHHFSAICGVADIYNAMTTARSYRPSYPPHEVYELILGLGSTHFDYDVIKAFARCIVPYPRGSLIRTSDLRIAQVVSNDTEHPYLPVVVFLDDPEDKEVNLLAAGLTVKSAVTLEEKELSLLNRQLPVPADERCAS